MMTPHNDSLATPDVMNKRRQLLLNPSFQWKYTFSLAVIVFLITTCLSSVLYSFLHQQARQRMLSPEEVGTGVGVTVITFSVVFSLLTSVFVGLWCFLVTHRICGPLFVIDRFLRELGNGVIPKLRPLRKKDEFKDLFATFSRTTEALRNRKQQRLSTLNDLQEKVDALEVLSDEERRAAVTMMSEQIHNMRLELAATLRQDLEPESETQSADAHTPEPVGAF